MEHFNLQLVLLVVGIVVILFVLWDSKRRRVTQRDSQENVSAEEVEEFYQQRDGSGYDVLGVGLSRIVTTEDELVANRSDDIALEQESLVASRDDDLQSVDSDIDKTKRQPKQSSSRVLQQPDLIVSITLLSKQESFNGEKLLHCMLSRGLRFGDMDIFHRHKHTSGEGPIQFSLANALKPGTFNLDDMNSFKTRAVTLFMILPGPKEPLKAYELMLETAQHLATELDGQLLDDTKSALTQQTVQHFKEQIVDFERTQSD
ncbi:MAG: cell division protein ZipA [Gammaproteobacteria bacterium]